MTPDEMANCTQAVCDALYEQGYEPSACILGTRVLIDVLAYFGVEGSALPVRVLVLNQAGAEQMEKGIPISEWPDEAWSVGVDDRNPDNPTVEEARAKWRFPAHLVVQANGYLLDPTADQMDRPQRGLRVLGSVAAQLPDDFFDGGYVGLHDPNTGTRMFYSPSPLRPHTWKSAPDWTKDHKRKPLVAAAIKSARRRNERTSSPVESEQRTA